MLHAFARQKMSTLGNAWVADAAFRFAAPAGQTAGSPSRGSHRGSVHKFFRRGWRGHSVPPGSQTPRPGGTTQ
ncbi:hypothetical protein BN18_0172 [Klebsiella pneumoniae subsp. pneumoniae ST512-K30BO]|nr:hypothetical protein BN18_0172 [Klebsiella pneumoniae subsp. pneumoniae ST512-K30BO]